MTKSEPVNRRLLRVACVVMIGACSATAGMLMNNIPPRTAFLAGGIMLLAMVAGLIPVLYVMLRLERNNWQYSLRTLIITMTLLAVTLSAVAFALRQ